jgi:uncharacterized protein YecE (DUF72 family)
LPVKRWFAFYSAKFDTVEINNTFYRLPAPEVFRGWRRQARLGFLYAIKASRYLTHVKKLKDPDAPLDNILGPARELGPLLYQLPPHWRCDVPRLRQFISQLPADITHVLEFPDPSWYNDAVRAVLCETGTGFCIHDMAIAPAPFWVCGRVCYVRLHGPTAFKYSGNYGRTDLQRWAERIRGVSEDGHQVFVYFNNDWGACAVRNALDLREMIGSAAAPNPGSGNPLQVNRSLFDDEKAGERDHRHVGPT